MCAGLGANVSSNVDACWRRHAEWFPTQARACSIAQGGPRALARAWRAVGGVLLAASAGAAAVALPPPLPGTLRPVSSAGAVSRSGSLGGSGSFVRLAGDAARLAGLRRTAALPGRDRLGIDVVLRPRDEAALGRLATAVSTPGSALFHHPITLAEFDRRFGVSAAQVRRSELALRAQGLTQLSLAPDDLVLHVTTTVAGAERAFGVTLYRYADRRTGRIAGFAASGAPRVRDDVVDATGAVIGLDSLAAPRPAGLVLARLPRATSNAPTSSCPQAAGAGLSPAQVAAAYGLDQLYDDPTPDLAAGVPVAVVEFAPYVTADLDAFAACYGLDASRVTSESVDGGAPPDPQGSIEGDLDVEELLGLAPRASITVWQAPNTDAGSIDAFTKAVDSGAAVVSTSWGLCEAALDPGVASAENELFEQAAALGESVIAASGDEGSEDCTASTGQASSLQVDDPASQPFVTGVGGTTLSLSPRSETGWNAGDFAGGGGLSTHWPMPAYQAGPGSAAGPSGSAPAGGLVAGVINSDSSGTPCKAPPGGYCREVPDVSADAGAPYGIVATVGAGTGTAGTWVGVEGTSGAAPTWAALLALADASVACAGKRVGFANPGLYAAAAGGAASAALTDVTAGAGALDNSIRPGFSHLYPVTAGYDMATGLGSPLAGSGLGEHVDDGLVDQLCQGAVPSGSDSGASGSTTTGTGASGAAPSSGSPAAGGAPGASAGAPGTGHATAGGSAGRPRQLPVLRRFVPARGPQGGGVAVVLHGSRLGGTEAVWFGARRARVLAVSATRVSVVAPPGRGSVVIRVRTTYGTAASGSLKFAYTGTS